MSQRNPIDRDLQERQFSLAECEAVIERGLATFVEVGSALLTIRDQRLYRESHKTFETYCRERWSFGRQRAAALIEAAETAVAVSEISDIAVRRESHAAELAPLKDKPEEVAAAWREVQEETNGQPTALAVREVVAQRLPDRPVRTGGGREAIVAVDHLHRLRSTSPKVAVLALSHQERRALLVRAIAVCEWIDELVAELQRVTEEGS